MLQLLYNCLLMGTVRLSTPNGCRRLCRTRIKLSTTVQTGEETSRQTLQSPGATVMDPSAGPDENISSPARPPGRQQRAAAACDECRRRKLRCDGQQPQCRVCRESGHACETTLRGTRGPKKGYIKALKSRVVHLEALLESRLGGGLQENEDGLQDGFDQRPALDAAVDASDGATMIPTPPVDMPGAGVMLDCDPSWLSVAAPEMLLQDSSLPDLGSLSDWSLPSIPAVLPTNQLHITSAMHAEL